MSEVSAEFIACLVNVLHAFKRGEWDSADLSTDRFDDENEIELIDLLRGVQLSVLNVTALAEDIAEGNYSTRVKPLSDRDELGRALFEMTETLRDVVKVAGKIADGDFSERVDVKGENDLLAVAMNRTVEHLQRAEAKNRSHSENLQKSNDDLEIAGRYKSEFLANMSHELRTPLNSIIVLARLLEDSQSANLTTRQLDFARTIKTAGMDLLSIINDILDLSKVEAGKMDFLVEPLQVDALVRDASRQVRPLIEEQGLGFRIEVEAGAPVTISSDSHRIGQILKNLLANAMKFTSAGEIVVRVFRPAGFVSIAGCEAGGDMCLAIEVADTGIGIDADKLDLVFGEFTQADGTISRQFGGTGLGLTISRKLARDLGGDLRVDSTVGRGSAFTLYLPAEARSDAVVAFSEPPLVKLAANVRETLPAPSRLLDSDYCDATDTEALGGESILVVARDMRSVFAMLSTCEKIQVDIIHARSCRDAIEVLASSRTIDLVLIQSESNCRSKTCMCVSSRAEGVPVVVIVDDDSAEKRQKYLEAGADAVFEKPVSFCALLSEMNRLLKPTAEIHAE